MFQNFPTPISLEVKNSFVLYHFSTCWKWNQLPGSHVFQRFNFKFSSGNRFFVFLWIHRFFISFWYGTVVIAIFLKQSGWWGRRFLNWFHCLFVEVVFRFSRRVRSDRNYCNIPRWRWISRSLGETRCRYTTGAFSQWFINPRSLNNFCAKNSRRARWCQLKYSSNVIAFSDVLQLSSSSCITSATVNSSKPESIVSSCC